MDEAEDGEPADDRRRPLKTRSKAWAQALARAIARTGITPNMISVASVVFALGGAACFVLLGRYGGWPARLALALGAAAGIQLRLLCNMIDGMVAVEGGKATPVGDLYNEVPDRIADLALLAAAGYAAAIGKTPWLYAVELGWLAAGLAVLTAYVRALGVSLGTPQFFHGPMAKPHRMFTLTVAALVAAGACNTAWWPRAIHVALAVIVLGMLVTLVRRLARIAADLRARAGGGA